MVYIYRLQELFLSMPAIDRTADRVITPRYPGPAMLALATLLLSACVNSSRQSENSREYLDPLTGVTITALAQPLILAHAEPRISSSLRDYLYVGPVEVNRMGKRSYYLWISPFSTLDRPPISFNRITLKTDSAAAELDLPASRGNVAEIKTPPYARPLGKTDGYYIPISAELLIDLARAESILIETHSNTQTQDYELWRSDTAALRQFADSIIPIAATNQL